MTASDHMLDPSEVEYLHTLYHDISTKPWFTSDPNHAELFASRLAMFYQQLDIPQDRFADFAETHAKKNFQRKVQFDQDVARIDY